MADRKQLVCLSHEPWRKVPTRTQRLLAGLEGTEILFFEPASQEGRGHSSLGRRVGPNIKVYTMPDYRGTLRDMRALTRFIEGKALRFVNAILQQKRFYEPALWLTNPGSYLLAEELPSRGLVYDCFQEWDRLPLDWESELALHADVAFAASPGLARRLSPCCDNIAVIPNGVGDSFFEPDLQPPLLLEERAKPILCRVGPVTRLLDLEPLLYAARERPQWTFLLLGQTEREPRRLLSQYPNIMLPGQLPVDEVPHWLSGCSACFELLSRDTRGSDILPGRFYEYLALGKPVVLMVDLDQVEPFPDMVYTAVNPTLFLRRCQSALSEDPGWLTGRRIACARKARWSERSAQVRRILESAALL